MRCSRGAGIIANIELSRSAVQRETECGWNLMHFVAVPSVVFEDVSLES